MTSDKWILPFGKHKGKPVDRVETEYLEWLCEQDWFIEKFDEGAEAVGREIEKRQLKKYGLQE